MVLVRRQAVSHFVRHRTGARAPVQTWREAKLNGPLPRLVSSESKPLGRAEERGGAPDVAKPNLSLNSGDLTSRASRSVPNACTAALNEVRESSLFFPLLRFLLFSFNTR